MIKDRDVRALMIRRKELVVMGSERTLNRENTSLDSQSSFKRERRDNTSQDSPDRTDNISQDSPDRTDSISQDSPDRKDNTNLENRGKTVSLKMRKEEIEKRILIYLSGISKLNQLLDQQAEAFSSHNLPPNLQEPNPNPKLESSKLNKSPSRNSKVKMAQEEEELFAVIERRLQLKKEDRNDD